jgi:hypothetical protein
MVAAPPLSTTAFAAKWRASDCNERPRRERFAWEYKGKHKNMRAAYQQLLQYHGTLENSPLLVACDLNRFEVHTKLSGTPTSVYAFDLEELARNEATVA